MRNAPVRIVLIRAGKYEYAEVELDGALQIVGDNNMGKTTLINTLQFLYIDERNKMNFGSYSLDQSFEYYFPSQYSYVLFECRTLRGQAVIGWQGNSKASNVPPARFWYLGPYLREHFFTDSGQVREPRDVRANLALCELQLLPKPQQHREMLLVGAGTNGSGLGIVSLRDNDKFHQFRETLKNLLSLSTISQDQMRDRLLMLAGIQTDAVAVEARRVLGDDHDRLLKLKKELELFKSHASVIRELIDTFTKVQQLRGELMYRWTALKQQKQAFETGHREAVAAIDQQIAAEQAREQTATSEAKKKRGERDGFIAQKTTLENDLVRLDGLVKEFAGFGEELERAALGELEKQVFQTESILREAAMETIEEVQSKLEEVGEKIGAKEQAIDQFGELVVTALREKFKDDELSRIFGILNSEILELPLGRKGVTMTDQRAVIARLRQVLDRTSTEVYQDELLTVRYRLATAAVAKLQSIDTLRKELLHLETEQQRVEKLAVAVREREKYERGLTSLKQRKAKQADRIHRFDAFQQMQINEKEWRKDLANVHTSIAALDKTIQHLEKEEKIAAQTKTQIEAKRRETMRHFDEVMKQFERCRHPIFDAAPKAEAEVPPEFESAIAYYLKEQEREKELAQKLNLLFSEVQKHFADRFEAATEGETVRNLTEELDAVDKREEALSHEWNAHIHGLKSRFKQVLDDLNQVQTATTRLNKSFADVQVSDLREIKLLVEPNADTVGVIKRLAGLEELDLWANQAPLETALQRVREWLDKTPIIRISELFTLAVFVTAADGKVKHYRDFRQIESDGTTVAIKVLFNLLVLKSQLRKDDVAVPFFLDEIEKLDAANRRAVLQTAKALGFIAITAAPSAVGEVDACYFLEQRGTGSVKLTSDHRLELQPKTKAKTQL